MTVKLKLDVKKIPDTNGNGDDVFKASKVAKAPRLPASSEDDEQEKQAGFDGVQSDQLVGINHCTHLVPVQEEWCVVDRKHNRVVSSHVKEDVARSVARVNNTAHWHQTKKVGRYTVENLTPVDPKKLEDKKKLKEEVEPIDTKGKLTELAALALEMAATGVITETLLFAKLRELKGS